MADDSVKLSIDGREVAARPGELLIAAAERSGTYIPRFCWHPRMKPVGMCRMCLVEIEGPRGKALQPACMLPVNDGMVVDTRSDVVKKAQDGVLEFLLINHPLDCPVCDRGGECPLQDQTMVYGPGESRFVEEKRHFEKPIPISPLVNLDRERCIQCARCTRFADEVAGDPLIDFVERGNQTQVLIFPDQPFSSYFSGNVVQICPVGALTATPYRFRARPWDLEQVESTCTSCAVGCRVLVQSSTDRLVRKLGIDSDPVNHGWLCDKGRFDYEATGHDQRLGAPLVRKREELVEASWVEALEQVADGIKGARDRSGAGSVAVLGGARLTNEDAYTWSKLARAVIGTDSVDCQLGDGLPAETVLGLPRATIDDACSASSVVLLAADLKEELPVLYLRLREAAVDRGLPLIEITPQSTGLTRHARVSLGYRPGEAAAVADALAGGDGPGDAGGVKGADLAAARDLLGDSPVVVLGRPSVSESGSSVAGAAAALAAIPGVRFLTALRRGNVHGALDMGLAPGVLPGRVSLAGAGTWFRDVWGALPEEPGLDATGILTAAAEGRIQALILLGADPLSDFPDRDLARRALTGAAFVVALDLFLTESSRQADVVLPTAAWGEKAGTTTSLEGRVSRLAQKVTPPGTARADWMIAVELAWRLGGDLGFDTLPEVWAEIERLAPSHAGLTEELLVDRRYRDGIVVPLPPDHAPPEASGVLPEEALVTGQAANVGDPPSIQQAGAAGTGTEVVPEKALESDAVPEPGASEASGDDLSGAGEAEAAAAEAEGTEAEAGEDTTAGAGRGSNERPPLLTLSPSTAHPESPPLDAYSLRLVVGRRLYDLGTLVQHCPSLAGLSPGDGLRVNPYDLDRLGLTTGGQVRVTSPRVTTTMIAVADPGVPRGSAALAFNQPGDAAADFIDATAPVNDVRIENL